MAKQQIQELSVSNLMIHLNLRRWKMAQEQKLYLSYLMMYPETLHFIFQNMSPF